MPLAFVRGQHADVVVVEEPYDTHGMFSLFFMSF